MGLVGKQETSEVISSNSYFGTLLIGTLPICGDILLYKWAKSSNVRESKQNLCVAYLKLKAVLLYPISILLILMGIYL